MSADIFANVIAEFIGSTTSNNTERALSLCAEDVTWIVPEGMLSGRQEIKEYLNRLKDLNRDLEIKGTGIDLIIEGNEAIYEYVFKGTSKEGVPWTVLAFSTYEFNGNKIKRMTTVFDRLAMVKQTAKGRLIQMAVASVVNYAEKGMK